jgi:predicted dehydrogenase
MKKVRLGVIGAGRMGITHLSLLNSDARVEISSIADTSGLVLDLLGRYLKCGTFKDYADLLRDDRPDALVICTPPGLHYPVAKAAGSKRMHVFAEKPFTTSPAKAFELADDFERANLVNQVGYVNRFNDVFVRVREMLTGGLVGRLVRYRSEMFSRTVIRPSEGGEGWRNSHESGGGATYEMAAHAIDLVNFLVGKPDQVVGATMNQVYSRSVEDVVSATFVHRAGCTGTLLVNWSDDSVRKPTNKIELFGDKGKILADQHSVRVYLRDANPEWKMRDGWNTLYITDVFRPVPFYVRGNEFTRQLYHFVDNIADGRRPGHCTFRQAGEALSVIADIFAGAKANVAV